MRLHTHVLREESRGKVMWHRRWFFHLHRGNREQYGEHRILDWHIEVVLSKPTHECGLMLGVGTKGSETPFKGHVKLFGTALYWGIDQGGGFADLITQRWFNRLPADEHKQCRYDSRRLGVQIFDNRLWWDLWILNGSWKKGRFAKWRDGNLRLNPLDHLYGDQRYWHDDADVAQLDIEMPEGTYPVTATLQQVSFGRPRSKRRIASWSVDVDAPAGIPDCYDKSGGWKGDRVYGFGVPLNARRHDWQIDAKAAISARILSERARTGFREPLLPV